MVEPLILDAIPEEPPSDHQKEEKQLIDDIGEPMNSRFFNLRDLDPVKWYSITFSRPEFSLFTFTHAQ